MASPADADSVAAGGTRGAWHSVYKRVKKYLSPNEEPQKSSHLLIRQPRRSVPIGECQVVARDLLSTALKFMVILAIVICVLCFLFIIGEIAAAFYLAKNL